MIELTALSNEVLTGGPLIAIVNYKDAEKFGLHNSDRVKLRALHHQAIALLDVSLSDKAIPKGHVALNIELMKKLALKPHQKVQLTSDKRPKSVSYIRKKLEGKELSDEEMTAIVEDTVSNALSDVELTYFVSAGFVHKFSHKETVALTKAMVNTGDRLHLKSKIVIDKHCIGGVAGNRTTMVVVPILAAAGLYVPKTSSRSITSPAGTADTMEVLANVDMSVEQMQKMVEQIGACIVWGGALNLAPADDKFIRVEHPLNIDAEGQLLASILAKKKSVSSTHVLIDIPTGVGAKFESPKDAKQLKRKFETLGAELGMHLQCMLTDGSEPIGNGIGPALEARDVLYVLRNDQRQPLDLRRKSIMLAGVILEMAGQARKGKGAELAEHLLESGRANDKMLKIIKAQGGKPISPDEIPVGKFKAQVRASHKGVVSHISNVAISRTARRAGAPRDKGAGIYLYKHVGQLVQKGDLLLKIYANNEDKLQYAIDFFMEQRAITVDPKKKPFLKKSW